MSSLGDGQKDQPLTFLRGAEPPSIDDTIRAGIPNLLEISDDQVSNVFAFDGQHPRDILQDADFRLKILCVREKFPVQEIPRIVKETLGHVAKRSKLSPADTGPSLTGWSPRDHDYTFSRSTEANVKLLGRELVEIAVQNVRTLATKVEFMAADRRPISVDGCRDSEPCLMPPPREPSSSAEQVHHPAKTLGRHFLMSLLPGHIRTVGQCRFKAPGQQGWYGHVEHACLKSLPMGTLRRSGTWVERCTHAPKIGHTT